MTDLNYKEMYENEVIEKTKLKQACKVLTEQNHELAVVKKNNAKYREKVNSDPELQDKKKQARKEWAEKNREKIKEYNKKYYENIKADGTKYYKKLERNDKWRAENKERVSEIAKAYYQRKKAQK